MPEDSSVDFLLHDLDLQVIRARRAEVIRRNGCNPAGSSIAPALIKGNKLIPARDDRDRDSCRGPRLAGNGLGGLHEARANPRALHKSQIPSTVSATNSSGR